MGPIGGTAVVCMVQSPLQSLGVGLPLSRMLLQHFHGNVTLSNNSGALGGCTAAIHLNKDDTLLEQQGGDEPNLVLDRQQLSYTLLINYNFVLQ